jgi:hypothetical protein
MKSLFCAICLVLLVGCGGTTIPVIKQKFPDPPELLMAPVPELKKLGETTPAVEPKKLDKLS